MVSITVCQGGHPGSSTVWLFFFQKGEYSISILLTCSANAADWFIKSSALCYYVYVIMHVKDTILFVISVGNCVPVAGFFLSLYSLHTLNIYVNIIKQTK